MNPSKKIFATIFAVILFFPILIFFNNTITSANEEIYNKLYNIMEQQQQIKNFQTEAHLNIKAFSKQNSSFNFIYYYHEPDFIHLETKDFVLLPTEPLKSLQPDFFDLKNYHPEYEGKQKDSSHLFYLTPVNNNKKFRIKIWVNIPQKKIVRAKVFFIIDAYQKEFSLNVRYHQIKNYSMPISIQGKIAIPTKFSTDGKIKKFNEGYFDLKLSNYKINQGLPPEIMEKYNNKN